MQCTELATMCWEGHSGDSCTPDFQLGKVWGHNTLPRAVRRNCRNPVADAVMSCGLYLAALTSPLRVLVAVCSLGANSWGRTPPLHCTPRPLGARCRTGCSLVQHVLQCYGAKGLCPFPGSFFTLPGLCSSGQTHVVGGISNANADI